MNHFFLEAMIAAVSLIMATPPAAQEPALFASPDTKMSQESPEDVNKAEGVQEGISDSQARLELARALTYLKRYDEALHHYALLLAETPDDPLILLEISRIYIAQKKFHEALTLLYRLIEDNPEDPELLLTAAYAEAGLGHAGKSRALFLRAIAVSEERAPVLIHYADTMMMWGDFYKVEKIYRAALAQDPESLDLALKLGWLLTNSQRYEEAEGVYRKLLLRFPQDPQVLKAFTALEKVYKPPYEDEDVERNCEDSCEEIPACLNDIISKTSSPQELEKWALLYIKKADTSSASALYRAALQHDPEYFPAQIGLAATLTVLYQFDEALTIYLSLLDAFPEDAKILIAIARVYAWSKRYELALCWYDAALALNPIDPVARREKARTALWGKRYDSAMASYRLLLSPDYPLEDTYAKYLIHNSVSAEKHAKQLVWDKRYLHALPAYRYFLADNPGNEDALFDFAQVNCILGQCDISQQLYSRILHIDPNHNLVAKAQQRSLDRMHLGLQSNITYWRELGTGSFSQSQIARYQADAVVEVPLSCRSRLRYIQHAWVENPFYNFRFYPAEGESLEGEWIFNGTIQASVGATRKNYFNEFKSRYTGYNHLLVNLCDYLRVDLRCDRINEIYNFFSLKQGIQSMASSINLLSDITRMWKFEGSFQHLDYNDKNYQNYFHASTKYSFTEEPDVFSVTLDGNYRNTKHPSISIIVGTTLIDVIHPYWTPQKYYSGSVTLEWWHDFRYFIFCEAPERYFDVKLTFEDDSEKNFSTQVAIDTKYEFSRHWGLEFKGLIHRSKQWNAEGAWATLSYRF